MVERLAISHENLATSTPFKYQQIDAIGGDGILPANALYQEIMWS